MFHKEGSSLVQQAAAANSSAGPGSSGGKGNNNNNNNSKKGGKNKGGAGGGPGAATSKTKKTIDVPLRKSDRRQLRQRAAEYLNCSPKQQQQQQNPKNNDDNNLTSENEKDDIWMETLNEWLDCIFLQGSLSARTLPYPIGGNNNSTSGGASNKSNKAWTMVLYLKSPDTANSNNNNDSASKTSSTVSWPFSTTTQFVWMALEEKQKVVLETPTVALWSILSTSFIQTSITSIKTTETTTEMKNDKTNWMDSFTVIVPSAVSKYVCRGADLMKAGIIRAPCRMNNQKRVPRMIAIQVKGNPQPFAVGEWKIRSDGNVDDAAAAFGPDTKGIGVEIWNTYGDELWRVSVASSNTNALTKKKPSVQHPSTDQQQSYMSSVCGEALDSPSYGNAGFVDGKYVLPLVASKEADNENEEADDGQKTAWDDDGDGGSGDDEKNDNERSNDKEAEEGGGGEEEDAKLSPEDILHYAVCHALVGLANRDLPMPTATFYAQHVLPNRPAGTTIELKSTRYKKFGQYLQEQTQRGLLTVGPDKNNKKNTDPMAMLLSYYKKHDDLQGLDKTSSATTGSGSTTAATTTKLVLVNLYVIPSHFVTLLRLSSDDVKAMNASSEERKGTGMLTGSEVRALIEKYLHRDNLIVPNRPDQVQLDGPLTDVLYGGGKKKNNKGGGDGGGNSTSASNQTKPEQISRKDLVQLFTSKLSTAYALVEMPGSRITKLAKGTPPYIDIEVSMRQSKKFVTRIRGFEEYGIDAQFLSKDISKRLACSSSVEMSDDGTLSSGRPALRKNHAEVVFQGNIVDELEALLLNDESLTSHGGVKHDTNDYPSIPKGVIQVTLRKGVPARKKRGGTKKKK